MSHAEQPPEQNLGHNLRQLRKERGWSLDRAASETGVSKAMLGQIERGESSPTLATLWKLAGGFHRSMSSLIEPAAGQTGKIRSADRLRQQPTQDQMLVAPLFPFDPQFGFELFELTLLPGYQRESEPHEPGVIEHVMVIEGTMELLLEGQWRPLQQGEAIRFAADQPHGYRNLGDKPAVFHNLIHYPAQP
ncbi:XRE family transcriptional regulator [Motiliproteus coralliicola]|uniref:XRE family transcriptional regulator n=1 Tax=Motiliproteus coralliicola TaxID=2283196 RepID=A0A369WLH1_9GAMM|nr:XRE family transcriptional regulator [Motiliproteus coralliicola]RDE22487.1 XRE family transcriptional regulator [Motiliproteus coralliicola]